MGRRGELFAPRLRVTPSPVQAFLCLGLGFRFRVSGVSKNRGESFSPRLRVTPSPAQVFMCLSASAQVSGVSGSEPRGSARTGEREMGRRGESFAPRLRVTPSPVQAFMCFMRRSAFVSFALPFDVGRWMFDVGRSSLYLPFRALSPSDQAVASHTDAIEKGCHRTGKPCIASSCTQTSSPQPIPTGIHKECDCFERKNRKRSA